MAFRRYPQFDRATNMVRMLLSVGRGQPPTLPHRRYSQFGRTLNLVADFPRGTPFNGGGGLVVLFRKTLSGIGSRVGARQVQGWN